MKTLNKHNYEEAKNILVNRIKTASIESARLQDLKGRVLAEDITAGEDVPCFDRSPYDGYAFRSADTVGADREYGITLRIIESIRAGQVPVNRITEGTAIRLMTGAPLPEGADAIIL